MRRGRMRAGVAALGLTVLLAGGVLQPTATEAAWTDAEHAQAAVTAGALANPPTITACTTTTHLVVLVGLVFESVTITWTSSYPLEMQRVYFGSVLGTVSPTQVGAANNGIYTYTVTYSEGLLSSLLTSLLGSTTPIKIQAEAGSWVSPSSSRSLSVALLGLNPRCT